FIFRFLRRPLECSGVREGDVDVGVTTDRAVAPKTRTRAWHWILTDGNTLLAFLEGIRLIPVSLRRRGRQD
ncbi:hypothetical protein, partial [Pseudomonas aeruginosa]|uniref:hypothetical protein n=1 Tax=Pseudomonas aeruginosa TaxID=287 RepID=UPI001ABC16EF